MNRPPKFFFLFAGVLILFFAVVISRIWAFKPPDSIRVVPLAATQQDPAVWATHYPLEYASYQKNSFMGDAPTGYGSNFKTQKSELQPELTVNYAGNPFSLDYAKPRGHLYALADLADSKRINAASKAACITCKTPYVETLYQQSGWGYANLPLAAALSDAKHPVSCANCHDPATMNLRVVNPAFIEAMQRRGVDVASAGRQEMRSYVCGQCHATYYFEPGSNRVVFPWDNGLTAENMYQYFSTKPGGFTQDWRHAVSSTPLLKARHPDFEAWSGGVHGKAGVSCADCHMPFVREKGQKYTSHWVTSPLRNVEVSCYPCHNQDSSWLIARVKTIQDNVWQLQRLAGQTIAAAHQAIAAAAASGDPSSIEQARESVRKAQWYWDVVASENSMGFHNPDQQLNTLGQAIHFANQAIQAVGQHR